MNKYNIKKLILFLILSSISIYIAYYLVISYIKLNNFFGAPFAIFVVYPMLFGTIFLLFFFIIMTKIFAKIYRFILKYFHIN